MSDFDRQSLSGIWWEYQWEASFSDNLAYACSRWSVMEDVTQYRSFNHIHTAADMSDTRFAQVDLLWTARDNNGDQP
jgi:hypothetical protein